MSLSDYIEDLLPGWMRKTHRQHWRLLAESMSLTVDALIEGLYQGRYASFPGQTDLPGYGGFGSLDALPLIGRDRGIVAGPAESPEAYARRLRMWRRTWKGAGTAQTILDQLAGAISPNPTRIRLVTSGGWWYTREPDGTFIHHNIIGTGYQKNPDGTTTVTGGFAHLWNWGGGVEGVWPIIYAPATAPLNDDEGAYGDFQTYYGDPGMTIGTSATVKHVALIRAISLLWKSAAIPLPYIIIAFDPASFDPLTPDPYPAPGMPDGTWHLASKLVTVGGRTRRTESRLKTARYWKGEV